MNYRVFSPPSVSRKDLNKFYEIFVIWVCEPFKFHADRLECEPNQELVALETGEVHTMRDQYCQFPLLASFECYLNSRKRYFSVSHNSIYDFGSCVLYLCDATEGSDHWYDGIYCVVLSARANQWLLFPHWRSNETVVKLEDSLWRRAH